MYRSLLTLGLLAFVPALVLTQEEKPNPNKPLDFVKLDRKDPMVYEKDVEPILVKKCLVCHSGPVKEAKLDLATYEALMKGGKRGKSVIPGKGEESLIIKLCSRNAKPHMPPKSEEPLSAKELTIIKVWIDEGAKAPSGIREKPKAIVGAPPAQVTPVRAVAITPDKNQVAAGRGNQIHLFEANSGNHVKALIDPGLTTPDKKPVQAAHLSLVESLAFSPDGKLLVSGGYQEAIIWDLGSGAIKQKLTGFADRVVTIVFSPDGKLIATGGGAPTEDGEIKVFEVETGKLVVDIKNGHSDTVYGACFSPDGTKLATCGADKFVKVFELPSGKFIKSFEGHTHHVMDVGWKSDGKLLASGGAELPTATAPSKGVIKVWDFEKGEQVRTINTPTKPVSRLRFLGKTSVIVVSIGDGSAARFNVDNGGAQGNLAGAASDYLHALDASPDGTLIAAGGEEGVVRVYNGANGQLVKTLTPPGVEQPKK
ncbi:MAG: NB-ARC domain protein [Planctomycetia bacterium]|nr:NB-ARC domain protein [Planctomycetia bacterium]